MEKRTKEELVQSLKDKITHLMKLGVKIDFLPSEQYRTDIVKIDKIVICKCQHQSAKDTFWVEEVYVDFMKYPILSGDNAEEVRKHLAGTGDDLLTLYLTPSPNTNNKNQ